MDARRLLTFREVARRRSFSRAAHALALTQPAVSQQVAALERTLGLPLLVRAPGGPVPTPAGELLLGHADAVADRLALAAAQVEELAGRARRHLRVGAFPSAIATIVPSAIARLRDADPAVEVDVVEAGDARLLDGVRRGELHLALVFADVAAPAAQDGLPRAALFEEPFVAGLPPGHRLARRRRIRLADLGADTWTAPSRSGLIARALRAAGADPEIAYVTSDPLAIGRLVAAGLAVTLAPQLLAESLPGIAVVEVADAPQRRVDVVTPPAGRHPLVAPFADALAQAAASGPTPGRA